MLRRSDVLDRLPLRDAYAALHCRWLERDVPVTTWAAAAVSRAEFKQRTRRLKRSAAARFAAIQD